MFLIDYFLLSFFFLCVIPEICLIMCPEAWHGLLSYMYQKFSQSPPYFSIDPYFFSARYMSFAFFPTLLVSAIGTNDLNLAVDLPFHLSHPRVSQSAFLRGVELSPIWLMRYHTSTIQHLTRCLTMDNLLNTHVLLLNIYYHTFL